HRPALAWNLRDQAVGDGQVRGAARRDALQPWPAISRERVRQRRNDADRHREVEGRSGERPLELVDQAQRSGRVLRRRAAEAGGSERRRLAVIGAPATEGAATVHHRQWASRKRKTSGDQTEAPK